MAKLGFLGLGIMGYPMARNLMRAGHEVAVWSNTASKAKELADSEKGVFCETAKQVGEFAECVFLCVGDTEMSEQVILGPDGIADGARAGAVVVDASTVSPSASRSIGERWPRRKSHFLDAPCTGSQTRRAKRKPYSMIGGDKGVYERVRRTSSPWANVSTTAAARAWACTRSSARISSFPIF